MKITPVHFETLSNKIEALLEKHGREAVIEAYETGNFPRSEKTKDLQTRFNFDLLVAVFCQDRDFMVEVYKYLNDAHISTALKKICPKITRKY